MYIENREKISKELQKAFPSSVKFLLSTGSRPVRAEADSEYPGYRITSNVKYLLGDFGIDSCILLVSQEPNAPVNIFIFLPLKTPREQIFNGPLESHSSLKERLHVQGVYDMPKLLEFLSPGERVSIASPIEEMVKALGPVLNQTLVDLGVELHSNSLVLDSFAKARFYKSEWEIKLIQQASQIAAFAHQQIEQRIQTQAILSGKQLYSNTLKQHSLISTHTP